MRARIPALIAALVFLAIVVAKGEEAATALAGTWTGPWYRGMTSGVMTLQITPDGGGEVQFTNLDNFGDAPAKLFKVNARDGVLDFSASGAGSSEFTASAQLVKSGSALRGAARYEGFSVKFELKRVQN